MTSGRTKYRGAGKPHQVSVDELILAMLRRGAVLESSQIAARLGRNRSHVRDCLNRLVERGEIVAQGVGRYPAWKISASQPGKTMQG